MSEVARAAGDGQVQPANSTEGGVGQFVRVTGNLARAAGAITRRLTFDLAETAATAGKDVFDGARQGKPSSEIAAAVMNDWFEGARKVLGVDEELQRMGKELKGAAEPMAQYLPTPVKEVVQQVAEISPFKAVTGMTVADVRANLRKQGRELLLRSAQLDDPDEHPAMSVILREISPDEARILRYLGERGPQAVIDVVASNPMTRKQRQMLHNFSIVGLEAACLRPWLTTVYLDNLSRLGLVSIRNYRTRSQRNYDLLLCQPEVTGLRKPKGRLVRLKKNFKSIELSDFGKEIFRNCLESETSRLAPAPDWL